MESIKVKVYSQNDDGGYEPHDYELVLMQRVSDDAKVIAFHVPEIGRDVAAIAYDGDDGLFTTSDWQGLQPAPEEVGDDMWSWVYYGEDGWSDDTVVVDGLPRLVPGAVIHEG